MNKRKQVWVDAEFKKKLKLAALKNNKSVLAYTKEVSLSDKVDKELRKWKNEFKF